MRSYLFRRILFFIPTLLVILLLAFGLTKVAPGDPVIDIYGEEMYLDSMAYERAKKELGLDRPPFYFSLSPQAYPKGMELYSPAYRQVRLEQMIGLYGNWPQIIAYEAAREQFQWQLEQRLPDSLDRQRKIDLNKQFARLETEPKVPQILGTIRQIQQLLAEDPAFKSLLGGPLDQVEARAQSVAEQATRHLLYQPDLKWFGSDNQFHHWLSDFLKGDFGISYQDKRAVVLKVKEGIYWTLVLNLTSFILAFFIALPLGVYAAIHRGTWKDRLISISLFVLFSLPTFWVATIAVVFLTSSTYGSWLDIFACCGVGNLPSDAAFWARFRETSTLMILPVLCQTYVLLAFISRQMRGGMIDVLRQDYIRTARAKGLRERVVVWKHAFRNSLFPIITIFASIFPAAIAGSVVIEVIFGIPGMGLLTFNGIFGRDWPVVFTVLIFSAVLTLIGILVADVLYLLADPRVRLNKSRS